MQNANYFLALVCILVSVISASYYLKVVKLLHMSNDDQNLTLDDINNSIEIEQHKSFKNNYNDPKLGKELKYVKLFKINNLHSFTISILTLSILFFILKPSLLLNSIQLLSLSLFNF